MHNDARWMQMNMRGKSGQVHSSKADTSHRDGMRAELLAGCVTLRRRMCDGGRQGHEEAVGSGLNSSDYCRSYLAVTPMVSMDRILPECLPLSARKTLVVGQQQGYDSTWNNPAVRGYEDFLMTVITVVGVDRLVVS